MGRTENIAIFEDTTKLCSTDKVLKECVRNSIKQQKFLSEQSQVSAKKNIITDAPTEIVVSQKRSLEAAMRYHTDKVCVLNFASAVNPGGGVTKGATAQEECICRCSTLYNCLNTKEMWNCFYGPHRREKNPLHNDDIIYTPGVMVFKIDTASPKLMPVNKWKMINIITCAAPNLRTIPSDDYNLGDGNTAVKINDKELLALHEKRLRKILDIAAYEQNEVIILGAFGCGAFRNKPEVVANAAKNVLLEYRNIFKVIEFAIYCSPMDERNYEVFRQILT